MNKNILIAIALFAVVIVGVFVYRSSMAGTTSNTMVSEEVSITPAEKSVFAVYAGQLPCADCEGIDTVLTLNEDLTYTMSSTYLGRDVAPLIEKGKWTTLRGDATNPDATVYQLYTDDSETKQNYLVDGNEIKQLDQDLNLIQAPFNTSLMKKSSE